HPPPSPPFPYTTLFRSFVLQLAGRMADDYGCVGVVVDAKPGAVEFYARYGFAPVEVVLGASAARPQPKPMFLAMRAIKAASDTADRKSTRLNSSHDQIS